MVLPILTLLPYPDCFTFQSERVCLAMGSNRYPVTENFHNSNATRKGIEEVATILET